MGTPHKHADVIKSWADGADIQSLNIDNTWDDVKYPVWNPLAKYRIKPEPKLITKMVELSLDDDDMGYAIFSGKQSNLKVVFDGNTKKILEVEIIA